MKRTFAILLPLVIILFALPLFQAVPEFWINQLNSIGISSLVVLGLAILTGYGGMTSFGQTAFVGLGAYATAYLSTVHGVSPWIGLVVGVAMSGVVAYVIGAITLRLSGHYLSLTTIALGLVFFYLFGNMYFLGRYDGIPGIPPIQIFGFSLLKARHNYYLIWIVVMVALWLSLNLLNSRPGRAIRALNKGAGMAQSFGVNTQHYKVVAFVYAALLSAVAGWLYAHEQRAVSPSTFGIDYGIEYLFMAIIGGVASVWGAILGAAIILILKDQIQSVAHSLLNTSVNIELIVFGVLMILILQYLQDGLWPLIAHWCRSRQQTTHSTLAQGVESLALDPPDQPLQSSACLTKDSLILKVQDIRKTFGGLVAVNQVNFELRAGQIMGLIGPNGAGKSTSFNLITGVLPLTSGKVFLKGQDISHASARKIAQLGVARTFQHVQLLPQMSVIENVALGAHLRESTGVIRSALHLEREAERRLMYEAMTQLKRVGLEEFAFAPAGSLALGQQRIVEIARALALDPCLLLLDEPAAGLRYQEKHALAQVLKALRQKGMAILLVEHDMDFVMRLTNHLVVMDFGTQIAEGTPQEIQKNPAVLQAYLGGLEEEEEVSL